MSEEPSVPRPRVRPIEVVVCAVLVTGIALFALAKMDYLSSATAHHVRMTDNSRTAYVAKNLVEGRGYTTLELPAFMLDFYDQAGKLHDDAWVNADRFPFTTFAIAALELVTRSTSYEVGILVYNVLCFVGFMVLLYWFARSVWGDKWAALATLGIALLHPMAYVYPLYLKDADMLLLTTAVLATFYRYFTRPPDRLSTKLAVAMGTFLAWAFLDRPNVGGGFILYFILLVFGRIWRAQRELGWAGAIRAVARREGIVFAAIAVWCLPFAIHSMSEWGSPFFSANGAYQMPLGTRYAMETDTWYKYSEPGHPVTLGTLIAHAPDELVAKFTTSWVATLKSLARTYAVELFLGLGLLAWMSRRARAETKSDRPAADRERDLAWMRLAKLMGFCVLVNFLLLPLYGYQNYPYRHYLSFFVPFIWLSCGYAIVLIVQRARPAVSEAGSWIRDKPERWIVLAIVGLLAWNLGANAQDENQMFVRTADFVGKHWLTALIILALFVWGGWLLRRPGYWHVLALLLITILVRYRPYYDIKRLNLNWFPVDTAVWDKLKERNGLVMSFALQGEVNWVSDRRNIPAPELAMHVYSFLFDHQLEVEDVYIESAELMIGPADGPFYGAAPGFESYARLQRYQGKLPGYEIVFHKIGAKAYPKFNVKKVRQKASTVYRLVDRDAVRAMAKSPARIELGKVDDVVYTAWGWGEYFTVDGKPAVAATDAAASRYVDAVLRPWEDTSTTFFLEDDRRPTSVDLEIYGTHGTQLTFYWNLDLYYYDAPADRKAHQIGTYTVTQKGWQKVHLDIPKGVTRKGLNKLGFHASTFQPIVICPTSVSDAACVQERPKPSDPSEPDIYAAPIVVHDDHVTVSTPMRATLFAGTLEFHY